jgi:PRTRC genetic system protein F
MAAAFVNEVLRLHPQLAKRLRHDASLNGACAQVLERWVKLTSKRDLAGAIQLEPRAGLWGSSDHVSDYFVFDVHMGGPVPRLQPMVERAERAKHGLGHQLMLALRHVNYTIVDIATPESVRSMAEGELWCGCASDHAYRDWLVEGCGDDEEELSGHYMPSQYDAALGPEYAALMKRKAKLWSARTFARLARSLGDPWARELANQIHGLLRNYSEAVKWTDRNTDEPMYRIEPSYVLFWSEEDHVDHILDDVINQRYEAGDGSSADCVHCVELTDHDRVVALVRYLDAALPIIGAIDSIVAFLQETQRES